MNNSATNPWVDKEKKQLENSALRFVLLAVIKNFSDTGGIYGYGISKYILDTTQGELDATNATFYAILRRLEQNSLIYSQIRESNEGPPRKHFFITQNGLRAYDELKLNWAYYNGLVDRITNDRRK